MRIPLHSELTTTQYFGELQNTGRKVSLPSSVPPRGALRPDPLDLELNARTDRGSGVPAEAERTNRAQLGRSRSAHGGEDRSEPPSARERDGGERGGAQDEERDDGDRDPHEG